MLTVYISIGNSDDKLAQADWSTFRRETDAAIRRVAHQVHGAWVSPSTDAWQNACWCVVLVPGSDITWLRGQLANLAKAYGQLSVAWAETPETEFLCAAG